MYNHPVSDDAREREGWNRMRVCAESAITDGANVSHNGPFRRVCERLVQGIGYISNIYLAAITAPVTDHSSTISVSLISGAFVYSAKLSYH